MFAQLLFHDGDLGSRNSKATAQDSAQFSEVNRARQELVFRKNEPKEVRAKTTSREGADEDVGVEEHPHDTSRKTSSSLR
jgi:hypothetical protein